MRNDVVFSPAFGNRPTFLVGRDGVMDTLETGLNSEAGSRERSVVLLGQRGSGKTVLLWELHDRAVQKGYVVASPTVAADGMLERIVEKIQDNGSRLLKGDSAHLAGGTFGAFGFSVGLEFKRDVQETKSAEYRLTQLARAFSSQDVGLLILIDELQANSVDVRRLVIAYQELVGEGLNVALVMAGLPSAVSATLNDHVLTFLNRARKITLDPLRISDVDAFYQGAFSQMRVSLQDDDRRRFSQATEGSPYLMQLIGHNAVLRADEDGVLSAKSADCAVMDAVTDFENDVCGTTLAALSDKDEDFLIAMSQDENESLVADVANRMGVTVDYAQKYRRRLIDAGVVQAKRRGYVEFAVPYLKDYLRRRYDE